MCNSRSNRTVLIISILLFSCFSACAPEIKGTISPLELSVNFNGLENIMTQGRQRPVVVLGFVDLRKSEVMIRQGKQISKCPPEIVDKVQEGVASALKQMGYQVESNAPFLMTGGVEEWESNISGGSFKKVNSRAVIFVKILNRGNKIVYRGRFEGRSTMEKPLLDKDDIYTSLADAMGEAIMQAVLNEEVSKILTDNIR